MINNIVINKEIIKNKYKKLLDYFSKKSLVLLIVIIITIVCNFIDTSNLYGYYYISHTLLIMFCFYFFDRNIEYKNNNLNEYVYYLYHKSFNVIYTIIIVLVSYLLDEKIFIEYRYITYIVLSLFGFYSINKLIYRYDD